MSLPGPYPHQPPDPRPTPQSPQAPTRTPTAALVTLLGGLLVAGSAFLAWITVIDSDQGMWVQHGMEDGADGVIALLLGAAILALGIAGRTPTPGAFVRRAPIFLGVLAGLVALIDLNAVSLEARNAAIWNSDSHQTYVQTGPGLYVLLVGAIVTTLSGFAPRRG